MRTEEADVRRRIPVLDHGFVELVDWMGDDNSVVTAARVSYGGGTKSVREDRALLDYLMRHGHTSPFEMVEFVFHVKLPIFVARQIVRHRTASLNEVSARYSVLPEEFYTPQAERLTSQSTTNKQGSSEERVPNPSPVKNAMQYSQQIDHEMYRALLDGENLNRETARIILPLGTYTEWTWKIDLHNLFHFLKQRLDSHAQWETRQYALAKFELIRDIVPWACESFEEHVLNGKHFSASEWKIVRAHLPENLSCLEEAAVRVNGYSPHRAAEFAAKLAEGGTAPEE